MEETNEKRPNRRVRVRYQCRQEIALAIQLEREDLRVGSRQEVSRMQFLSGCPLHTHALVSCKWTL